MKRKDTIIHLEFRDENRPQQHYYFGSITAIFEMFKAKDIGVTASRLYQVDIDSEHPYINRTCIVRKGEITRKSGNRKPPIKIIRVI
jgi:hypothetical protein